MLLFFWLLGAWGGDSVGFIGCWILVEELIFFPWLLGDVLDFLFWLWRQDAEFGLCCVLLVWFWIFAE